MTVEHEILSTKLATKLATKALVRLATLLLACWAGAAAGRAPNGNDFALFYSEAATDAERQALVEQAGRRPHYFRYLQIMELTPLGEGERAGVRIVAQEPASALDIVFTVTQPVSLSTLRSEPAAAPGRAIAVSGVIGGIDREAGTIQLDPVVVRHKDRLAPTVGKEMRYEFDPDGTFYSFTGGREPVRVSYRDRDLLRHRDRIMAAGGDQAWADFLTRELQRRAAARRQERAAP